MRFIFFASATTTALPNGPNNSLGFPCAVKLLAFFVNVLKKHTVLQSTNEGPVDVGSSSGGDVSLLSGQGTPSSALSATTAGSATFQYLGDAPPDGIAPELVLAIKIINCMIVSDGNFTVARETLLNCKPLVSMIRDDLGLCLILLAGRTDLPPVVLQGVLSLFAALVRSLGPLLYVLVESFMVHVYLKSLNQLLMLLEDSSVILGSSKATSTGNSSKTNMEKFLRSSDSFSIEQLEMVLESLLDALSDASFLSMIFISFDCNPSRVDIFKPMFGYLCRCARYALAVQDSYRELGYLDVATNMSLQCLMQVVTSLGDRCDQKNPEGCECNDPKINKYELSLQLRAMRAAKKILYEASLRFDKKPDFGLRFLQSIGALPTPLTANSVAKFLRLSCDIPKEVVGSYLGELGKDNPKYEGDAKDFHKEVLRAYVKSFPLSGQDILACMRIFLSAFRLPGEAQQIDRILNAFSEHCFDCCIEKADEIIENAEIAYVLSFSIIMLNTDRHNVNIRADRKMTLEQFIKNNTNYGRDLKQTKDLPREYLEGIYQSISEFPLRTERKDETGSVTVEGWMDAQQQAALDTEKGLLTMLNYSHDSLLKMRGCIQGHCPFTIVPDFSTSIVKDDEDKKTSEPRNVIYPGTEPRRPIEEDTRDSRDKASFEPARFVHPNLETVSQQAIDVVRDLLTTDNAPDTFALSSSLYGHQALVDADLAENIWKDLLPVISCPFIMAQSGRIRGHPPSGFKDAEMTMVAGDNRITLSLAIAMAVIKISSWYGVLHSCDTVVLLLADFGHILKGDFARSLFDTSGLLKPRNLVDTDVAGKHSTQSSDRSRKKLLKILRKEKAPRAALCALLKLAHVYPQYLSVYGWTVVFQAMALLRDLKILPSEMVQYYVKEKSFDGLPGSIRQEFENIMDKRNAVAAAFEEPKLRAIVPRVKKSLLSFQGLGEALFGTSETEDTGHEEHLQANAAVDKGSAPHHNSAEPMSMKSRWDYGYGELDNTFISQEDNGNGDCAMQNGDSPDGSVQPSVVRDEDGLLGATEGDIEMSALKLAIRTCGIADIITDSKFVDDSVVLCCVEALVKLSDNFSGWGLSPKADCSIQDAHLSDNFDWSWNSFYSDISIVGSLVAETCCNLPVISVASASWFEVLLVELVVRNRDRISALWPHLAVHYVRSAVSLSSRSSPENCIGISAAPLLQQPLEVSQRKLDKPDLSFNYVDERRIVGLLKIATKMFSRNQLAPKALNLLHVLLCGGNAVAMENYLEWFGLKGYTGDIEDLCSSQYFLMTRQQRILVKDNKKTERELDFLKSWPRFVIQSMTAQIAVALWQMLTLNVSTLSHMQLAQWQQLFDIIAIASAGDKFAASKAFEVMAWLIHEPRLRGEVPVFSLSGVRPLLTNSEAHASIAIGAIDLLTHLHSRLEVLVSIEDENSNSGISNKISRAADFAHNEMHDENNSSALWEVLKILIICYLLIINHCLI